MHENQTSTPDTITSDDDPIGTRDWEGPIPTRRRRESAPTVRKAEASLRASVRSIERAVRARPLAVVGAAFGLGALAGLALRGSVGRGILVELARGLSRLA